ncbi:MAG TPA: cupredoxin domain-containing protein [Tepidiformaceae bacterium]|nr:cupredoxin domain-containing protein [Tepidiformaceae bacterium]
MRFLAPFFVAALAGSLLAAACGGDSGDRRVIQITQTDDSCSPATIDVTPGEKVKFEVKNDGKRDQEVEGIDGTKLEELLIPSGKTRTVNYTAPKESGEQKVKCYAPGGSSTILIVNVK